MKLLKVKREKQEEGEKRRERRGGSRKRKTGRTEVLKIIPV